MPGGAEPHATAAARAAPQTSTRRAGLAVLAGVAVHLAVGTGSPSLGAAAAAIASLGAAVHGLGPLRAAGWGAAAGLVAMTTSLGFVVAGLERAGLGGPAAALVLALVVAVHAVRFAVAGAAAAALARAGAPGGLAIAAAWLLAEAIDVAPLPWSLGAAAVDVPALTALAPNAGPLGAALAPCLVGAMILDALAWRVRAAGLAAAALVLLGVVGTWHIDSLETELAAAPRVRIAAVHGARHREHAASPPVDERRGAERAIAAGAALVALPEAALAVGSAAAAEEVALATLGDLGVPVVVGLVVATPSRNAAAVVDGGRVTLRDKIRPFPGGESRDGPWAWLGAPAGPVARGVAGPPIDLVIGGRRARIATAVCWDDLFSLAGGEADLVVVAINDGWFDGTGAAEAHLLQARLRAVVTGRPVIRATNLGATTIVDALGRVVARAPATPGGLAVADVALLGAGGRSGSGGLQ